MPTFTMVTDEVTEVVVASSLYNTVQVITFIYLFKNIVKMIIIFELL